VLVRSPSAFYAGPIGVWIRRGLLRIYLLLLFGMHLGKRAENIMIIDSVKIGIYKLVGNLLYLIITYSYDQIFL
jgi:hypothetical protein